MRKSVVSLLALGLGAVTAVPAVAAPVAPAAPDRAGGTSPPVTTPLTPITATTAGPDGAGAGDDAHAAGHELPNPHEEKRRELRERAITAVLKGEVQPEARNGSEVVKIGAVDAVERGAGGEPTGPRADADRVGRTDQYVELRTERVDRVFTLLVEFGDERHPDYPDVDTDPSWPGPERFDGPRHNEIPEPDRTVDNSTLWEPDFSREYFREIYFGDGHQSLKRYYERQSSGRYSIDGDVTDWVRVRYNEARYGRSNGYPCAGAVCTNVYELVADGMDQWVEDQRAAGRNDEEIRAELATFDVHDRYDFDHDGDFNEPDGYLDHLQIIHAGGDQADADPHQGEDAIWSHRAFVFPTRADGPEGNPAGGTPIGDTGFWVGDYTMQAENGGLSTIAHEYGHDLGLPDHYDTAGGDNNVQHWSLMAQSRLGGKDDPLGAWPGDLSAWDKLQLGWLDYEVVVAGQTRTIELGPHEYNSERPQGLVVVLPDKEVTTDLGDPAAGARMWWSGRGDDLDHSMTRTVDLTAATNATLSFETRYDIEPDYDFVYVQASTDGGATWTNLPGTVDGRPFGADGSGHPAISGTTFGEWVGVEVPLDAYAGGPIELRLRYRTDGGIALDGFFADEVTVVADGTPLFTSGAESYGDEGWRLAGFRATNGTEVNRHDNFYVASHRTHVSYDRYLATGPYNFGWQTTLPRKVEHFSYMPGLLISYWDTSQNDNNTSQHYGEGLILPIDSHPRPVYDIDGRPWRARVQVYDAPFSLRRPASFTLHVNGKPSYVRGGDPVPLFDDSDPYWFEEAPLHGVKVPDTGTRIRVLSASGTTSTVEVGTG
jgi:immune inhibitor A